MINMYLSVKRFNGENKQQNLTNFHTELKYSLNLLMNIKDIMDFIQELAHQRTIQAIDQDIRLYLHTYFNCEFTIILSIQNPFFIDSLTHIIGQSSNSQKFECSLSDLGSDIESVIKDKTVKQVITKQVKNDAQNLEKIIKKIFNLNLVNYSAFPVIVQDCC